MHYKSYNPNMIAKLLLMISLWLPVVISPALLSNLSYGSMYNQTISNSFDTYGQESNQNDSDIIPGSFIVVLNDPTVNETKGGKNVSEILMQNTLSLAKEIEKPGINVVETFETLGGFAFTTQGNYTITLTGEHPLKPASNSSIDREVFETITKLRNDPRVLAVEPDMKIYADALVGFPVDPMMSTAYDRVDADLNFVPDLTCPPGSNECDRSSSVVDIAIIDTGVAPHEDLNLKQYQVFIPGQKNTKKYYWPWDPPPKPPELKQYDIDDCNGHGTHVAGIAAAKANSKGVIGTAPGANIHSLRVIDTCAGSKIDTLVALKYVAEAVSTKPGSIDVVNMSIGRYCPVGGCKGYEALVNRVIDLGVPVVVAAGNEASDAINYVPARFSKAITVSNVLDTDGKCGSLSLIGSNSPVSTRETWYNYWTKGWTTMAPFTMGDSTYLFHYKSGDGTVDIDKINPGGKGTTSVWRGQWTEGWTTMAPFTMGDSTYLFHYKSGDGTVDIDKINPGGKGTTSVWRGQWTEGWTTMAPFTMGDSTYLF
ncbi:MAG: S8 family serine peptidase, partial [Candidatus Nitrosocosmicus sp.]